MAKFWTDVLVPLAIAGAVAAQTVGVEINRAVRLHAWFPQAQQDTTLTLPDTTLVQKDSIRSVIDSLAQEEDFDLFAENEPEDTLPKIFARDTMKVPDSLKTTDPFLYQWYVAVKDSYTHKLVVDSLKEAGDTLIWPVVFSNETQMPI